MPARLDPVRREVAVGSRRLPFRLDLRNDRVSVTLGGAEVTVRPLLWREKVTLARFAHLGPEFLREEVTRLCSTPELQLPLTGEDADVLWALATWMSEPPASSPVPLESRSLASVTLGLCRAMGLKPADFDGRGAPEVEAMWEALGSQPESEVRVRDSSSPASGSATRILIVPDERETDDRASEPAPSTAGSTEHATQNTQRGTQNTEHATRGPEPRSLFSVPRSVFGSTPSWDETGSVAMALAESTGEREMWNAEHGTRNREHGTQSTEHGTRDLDDGPRSLFRVPRSVFDSASIGAMAMTAAASQIDGNRRVVPEIASSIPVRIESLPLAPIEKTDPSAPLDFFEELADRLEQAAAEMGIGEG